MSRGEVAQVLHNLLDGLTPATTTTVTAPTTTTSTPTTTISSTTTTPVPPLENLGDLPARRGVVRPKPHGRLRAGHGQGPLDQGLERLLVVPLGIPRGIADLGAHGR